MAYHRSTQSVGPGLQLPVRDSPGQPQKRMTSPARSLALVRLYYIQVMAYSEFATARKWPEAVPSTTVPSEEYLCHGHLYWD